MKKIPLMLFSSMFALTGMAQSAEGETLEDRMTYFQCDFSNGIDAGFKMYDLDGQTYHFTMTQSGFQQGEAFATLREKCVKKENYYVASASKYKYAADEEHRPSNDWLVTPQIWIRGDHAVLSWRGKSFCSQKKNTSGYKVYVSTVGNRPEDFQGAPVLTVENESADQWVNHEVSLEKYSGKKIYIAFVNDNLDKEILGWDDICVSGEKGFCELLVTTGDYVFGQQSVSVDCAVTAYSDKPVTDVTAHYSWKGKTYTKHITGLSLKKHETARFSFDEQIPVACGDTVHYDVWAEVDGLQLEKETYQTISFLFAPRRKTVVEEGTGMWCGFCPCGIVAMDILDKKYPEEFIGIAIHYDDPMEVKDYRIAMDFPSFPSARFNRKHLSDNPMELIEKDGVKKYTTLNGGFETDFLRLQAEQALADVSLRASCEGTRVKVQADARFAVARDEADYRFAFVVMEDSVCDKKYYQTNYFAGEEAEMGGYEKLPAKIIAPVFRHVARDIFADYQGVPGSVPTTIAAGENYPFEYEFDLPKTVTNLSHVKIVALLLDSKTGEVVNANETNACVTGIASTAENQLDWVCRRSGDNLLVEGVEVDDAPLTVCVYTAGGQMVVSKDFQVPNSRSLVIPMQGKHGYFVVVMKQNERVKAVKLSF